MTFADPTVYLITLRSLDHLEILAKGIKFKKKNEKKCGRKWVFICLVVEDSIKYFPRKM